MKEFCKFLINVVSLQKIRDFYMLKIYSSKQSNRLEYVCKHLFQTILGIEYQIGSQPESPTSQYDIYYTEENIGKGLHIVPHTLLFESDLKNQTISVGNWEGLTTLFVNHGEIPFDLFAATFFLLSRYEEYCISEKDQHGRFLAEKSIAYQEKFLSLPLIDFWANKLKEKLLEHNPNLTFRTPHYRFIPTIDVDNVYAYRYHGVLQTVYCCLRDFCKGDKEKAYKRIKTVLRLEPDPYFNLEEVVKWHTDAGVTPYLFFHCGGFGKYDKRTLLPSLEYKRLRRDLAKKCHIGIHPSYAAAQNGLRFKWELWKIKNGNPIFSTENNCRYHYLRFSLPDGYKQLIQLGIKTDWSMCYSNDPGFRASTSFPFYFFDLTTNQSTDLLLYPTAVMDKTLKSNLHLSITESEEYIVKMAQNVKAVNGTFITLFHNQHFTDNLGWEGWKVGYKNILKRVRATL